MFSKILIANRGWKLPPGDQVRTRAMGIKTVCRFYLRRRPRCGACKRWPTRAVHIRSRRQPNQFLSDPREKSSPPASRTGAQRRHPGYGFLSEAGPRFCEALEKEEGIAFIGPKVKAIEGCGDKITSKEDAAEGWRSPPCPAYG